MLIDWFTVGAQIVNFLILVVVLKYLLYDRIIAAMDERERTIRSRIEEAEEKKKEAQEEAENYHHKVTEYDQKRDHMLSQAKEEVESERKDRMEKARHEVDQIQKKWIEGIQQQRDSFLDDLRKRVGKQVVSIARQMLQDFAYAELEQQMVEVFLNRIQKMDKDQKKEIAELLSKADHKVTVHSVPEISPQGKQKITKALRDCINHSLEVDYQLSPEMILGLEVRLPGHKIAWSIEDYLGSLESRIAKELDEKAKSMLPQRGDRQNDKHGKRNKEEAGTKDENRTDARPS